MGIRYYWVSYILQGTKFTLYCQIPLLHVTCITSNYWIIRVLSEETFYINQIPPSWFLLPTTLFVWAIKHQHTGHRCACQLVHKWIRIVMEFSWMRYVLCVVVYLVHLFHPHPTRFVLLHAWIKTSGLMPEFLWNECWKSSGNVNVLKYGYQRTGTLFWPHLRVIHSLPSGWADQAQAEWWGTTLHAAHQWHECGCGLRKEQPLLYFTNANIIFLPHSNHYANAH